MTVPSMPRRSGNHELADYEPMGTAIVVPIGPTGGAGQFPGQSEIVGREVVADVKGRHLMVDRYAQLFGLAVAAGGNDSPQSE
jgi:apoptosis-inducing factor 2